MDKKMKNYKQIKNKITFEEVEGIARKESKKDEPSQVIRNGSSSKIDWQKRSAVANVIMPFIGGITLVIAIMGVLFNFKQLENVRMNQSADLMLKLEERLSSDINSKIAEAIESRKPVFRENGGEFTPMQVDDYLGIYETVDELYQSGLIKRNMVYNSFSYFVVKTYEHPEVQKYIQDLQKTDPELFSGFQHLAQSFIKK